MKIILLLSIVSIMILAIMGCDSDDTINSENNISEVAEKYKTIVIPLVKQSDILYSPVSEAYKSITVPITKESDLH